MLAWDQVILVLLVQAILAIMVERALSLVFEHPWWHATLGRVQGFKEPIAFGVSCWIVSALQFDAVSRVMGQTTVLTIGIIVTAATIAGGSKGSNTLFTEILDIKSSAERARQAGPAVAP